MMERNLGKKRNGIKVLLGRILFLYIWKVKNFVHP